MVSVEEFELTLKEVVQAKRLSASKMAKLTEIASKSMSNDTQLVSILYRTHKSLSPSQKVSSLYVFDALVRAARSQVVKHGVTTPPESSGKGNYATFLSKIEGIVDGFFQDMISTGSSEAKDKTKKILDIWIKSSTLPSGVLNRLGDLIKDTKTEAKEKEPSTEKLPPTDPRSHLSPTSVTPPTTSHSSTPPLPTTTVTPSIPSTTPVQITTPVPPTPEGLQSTLLALLSQAASGTTNGTIPQTVTNTGLTPAPLSTAGLDASQLALLQQLTQTAKAGTANIGPTFPNGPTPAIPAYNRNQYQNGAGPSNSQQAQPLRYPTGPRNPGPAYVGPRFGPGRGIHGDDEQPVDPRFGRGGMRGGRGRGRWGGEGEGNDPRGRRGGDWESRSPQTQNGLPTPLGPRARPSASRSRSPQPRTRFGVGDGGGTGRKVPRQYSPPGRTPAARVEDSIPDKSKDEFGRDIRQTSVDGDNETTQLPPTKAIPAAPRQLRMQPPVGAPIPTYEDPKGPAATPIANIPNPALAPRKPAAMVAGGLQSFDFGKFEFTSPTSWEALGNAWQITNGYFPSQEELLQFVMMSSGAMSATGPGAMNPTAQVENRHTGGNGFGSGVDNRNWKQGGGEEAAYGTSVDTWDVTTKGNSGVQEVSPKEDDLALIDGSVGLSGKMQKSGDRWVFVRT